MKIRLVGAELFQADRRTGMKKLIVAFRNLAKAPKHERNKTGAHHELDDPKHIHHVSLISYANTADLRGLTPWGFKLL